MIRIGYPEIMAFLSKEYYAEFLRAFKSIEHTLPAWKVREFMTYYPRERRKHALRAFATRHRPRPRNERKTRSRR